jgi:hypothetical protein
MSMMLKKITTLSGNTKTIIFKDPDVLDALKHVDRHFRSSTSKTDISNKQFPQVHFNMTRRAR